MQARSSVWCIGCVKAQSTVEGRCDWAVLIFQCMSPLACFACSNRVIWNVFRGQEKWLGLLNMECIHHCVLIICIFRYFFTSLLCSTYTHRHGRAWPTAGLTGLVVTLDTWALPSTCYIKPMAMHESWATLAIIQGAVADVCLLEKCHSHPQFIEELTLGDTCHCTRDMCSASHPAVIMSGVSLGGHTFWEAPLCGLLV